MADEKPKMSELDRKRRSTELMQVKAALCAQELKIMELDEQKQRLADTIVIQEAKIKELEELLS